MHPGNISLEPIVKNLYKTKYLKKVRNPNKVLKASNKVARGNRKCNSYRNSKSRYPIY